MSDHLSLYRWTFWGREDNGLSTSCEHPRTGGHTTGQTTGHVRPYHSLMYRQDKGKYGHQRLVFYVPPGQWFFVCLFLLTGHGLSSYHHLVNPQDMRETSYHRLVRPQGAGTTSYDCLVKTLDKETTNYHRPLNPPPPTQHLPGHESNHLSSFSVVPIRDRNFYPVACR